MDYRNLKIDELPLPPHNRKGWPWDESNINPSNPFLGYKEIPRTIVVTPSFNQGSFIEETIRSVILQRNSNLDYWVIDGGSTDGSIEIIKTYGKWLTGWVSESDRGQADAINKGWKYAEGDYYSWINSDDLLLPDSLASALGCFEENQNLGYVFGDLEIINAAGEIIDVRKYRPTQFKRLIGEASWISQPGSLISGKVIRRIGYLDTNLHLLMDLDYWFRLGVDFQFAYLAKPLARFRKHETAKTGTQQPVAAREVIYVYDKFFESDAVPTDILSIKRTALANAYLYSARRWQSSGNLRQALVMLLRGLQYDWKLLFSSRFMLFTKNIPIVVARNISRD